MLPKLDLTGKRFGKLVVIKESEKRKRNLITWICECDCGNMCLATTQDLRIGDTKSCGCLSKEISILNLPKPKHNYNKHILYSTWYKMVDRCYNPKNKDYYLYGQRGIIVCNEWKTTPINFCDWGIQNGYKKGLTIDRIDNNGNYCPTNCRFVDINIQNRNKRSNINITINNETMCLKDWCSKLSINYSTAKGWIKRNKNIIQKLTDRMCL